MKTLTFGSVIIELQFNVPVEETGFLAESFDITKKPACSTIGISEILNTGSKIKTSLITGQIFQAYFQRAKYQQLDYLQKLSINGIEVWLIDDGSTICLLTKEEY